MISLELYYPVHFFMPYSKLLIRFDGGIIHEARENSEASFENRGMRGVFKMKHEEMKWLLSKTEVCEVFSK